MDQQLRDSISANLDLFSSIDPDPAKRYSRYWRVILHEMEEQGFFEPELMMPKLEVQMKRLTDFLEDKCPSAEKGDLQIWLSESALLTINLSKYPDLGLPDDPTTPVGFFKYLQPYPQGGNRVLVYAPCCFNILERILHGAEVCTTYIRNTWGTVDDAVKKTLSTIDENFDRLVIKEQKVTSSMLRSFDNAWCRLKETIPFYILPSSQEYYEEGIRHYRQHSKQFWVLSTTSGLIVPEEYSGEDPYCPGSGSRLPVGKAQFENRGDPGKRASLGQHISREFAWRCPI